MTQPMFQLSGKYLYLPWSNIYLPEFSLSNSTIGMGGDVTLTNPNGPGANMMSAPDIMSNTKVTGGTAYSPSSPYHPYTITNNAWLVEENYSTMQTNNLVGNGLVTVINSFMSLTDPSSQSSTSENFGLVNNSNLVLNLAPGMKFLAPIEIDSTSTITLANNPANWTTLFYGAEHGMFGGTMNQQDMPTVISAMFGQVASLTPGYIPTITPHTNLGGATSLTITDQPIVAHS